MRPRRARLGCVGEIFVFGILLCRFNEAEARAPRMRAARFLAPGPTECFNEAEARAPRMRNGFRRAGRELLQLQ